MPKSEIDKNVFDREISMCKELNRKNGGRCNWGECEKCGVIPFLYKLHKGMLLEKPEGIRGIKEGIFLDKSKK